MKFFLKDFCETVQARVVIFGMQVDNEKKENQTDTGKNKQEKTGSPVGGILVYICPRFRPSFRPSFHNPLR